jgi:hypothetical protein
MPDTSATDTEPAYTAEVWTYLGIRVSAKDKRMHGWRDPGGRELWYSDKGSFVIGGRYDVEVNRADDRCTRRTPSYAGEYIGQEERAGLEALDLAARLRLAGLVRERRDMGASALDEAIEPLLAVARTLRAGADRDALAAYVIRRLHTAW